MKKFAIVALGFFCVFMVAEPAAGYRFTNGCMGWDGSNGIFKIFSFGKGG